MMNENSTCDRAEDLVAVLYGEASEREARDFELHLKECDACRAEFGAFAQVREAVGEWRDEALAGFVSSQAPATVAPVTAPVRKSAVAAVRQFFALSPLWMKGAVGFAAVVFCVLAALAVGRLQSSPPEVPRVAETNPRAVYTKEDVERKVQEALAKQQGEQRVIAPPSKESSSGAKNASVAKSVRGPRSRQPFTRAEREQLAAELRLLRGGDDELDPLGDGINK